MATKFREKPRQSLENAQPEDERATVDVFFIEGERSDGPAAKSLGAVRSRDGSIIHEFNQRVARVDMPTEAIPALVDGAVANHVRTVPDLNRYDLPVIVLYTRPVQESDIDRIRELGGKVVRRFTSLNLALSPVIVVRGVR